MIDDELDVREPYEPLLDESDAGLIELMVFALLAFGVTALLM